MSLSAEEFVSETRKIGKKRVCEVCKVLEGLTKADRAVLQRMLDADAVEVSPGAIANVLNRHGHEGVTHQWVRTHRAKTCSGFKS